MEIESLGTTTLARIKKIVSAIELHQKDKDDENIKVTMEFLVGSLFPELLINFNKKISEEYHRGFKDGYKCKLESDQEDFLMKLMKYNISLYDENGNYKDADEILSEVSKKLTDVEEGKNEVT